MKFNLNQNIERFQRLPGPAKFSIVVLFSIGGIFLFSIFQAMLFQSDQSIPKAPTALLGGIPEAPVPEKNYRIQRRHAIDSLIDNRQLTPENLALIKARYPDSLCDCK